MFVKLEDRSYIVCWEHGTSPGGQKFTRCELHDLVRLEDPPTKDNISVMPSYEGMAVCSKKDQFCRDTGRKKSMSRALSNALVFPRDIRKKFWDAYFKMRNVSYDMKIVKIRVDANYPPVEV